MEPVRTYANLSVHTAEYVIAMRRYVFVSFSLVFVQIQFHLCCVMCSAYFVCTQMYNVAKQKSSSHNTITMKFIYIILFLSVCICSDEIENQTSEPLACASPFCVRRRRAHTQETPYVLASSIY